MQFSSIPFLIIIVFGFLWILVQRIKSLGCISTTERNGFLLLLLILFLWAGYVAYQSKTGFFTTERFLSLMPGYWLPYVPVVITVSLVMFFEPLRKSVRSLVHNTPTHWLTGVHIIRILAIGTMIKASLELFPEKFAWVIGGLDLAFGLSAIAVTLMVKRGMLSENIVVLWHLIGALVIIAPAAGMMHIFMQDSLFFELFAFPMVLAPSLVVPTLVMMNLMVAWFLIEKRFYDNEALVKL